MTGSRESRRILFFEGAEDGTTGGSHQSMFDVVRHLDRTRFEPIVAFAEENRFAVQLRDLAIEVHVLERERARERSAGESASWISKGGSAIAAVLRRARVLRKSRADLLHLNNSPLLGIDDWVPAALSLGIPCIANSMGRPYSMPRAPVRAALCRRLSRVRGISEYVSQELRAGGWDPRQVHTVPLSIDARTFETQVTASAPQVRAQLGIPTDQVLVAMVGNIREWKGQQLVVDALSRLPAALIERLGVLFIGATAAEDRPYLEQVEASVKRARLDDRVVFLGSRTDVANLIAASDVLVHASIIPEPFGLVVIEGMLLGKAVIAADSGGPRETITDDTGLLFETGNAEDLAAKLAAVVTDPEVRARLRAAAPVRARSFSIEREVAALQAVYEEALGSARR